MTDWISFVVAFGIVIPWLTVGACLLTEWTYETLSHRRRMRTDVTYREVETQFKTDLVEAGLDIAPADDAGRKARARAGASSKGKQRCE